MTKYYQTLHTIPTHLRIGLLLIALFIPTFASAGEWSIIHQEADELTEVTEHTTYCYEEGVDQFVFWSLSDYEFRLLTADIFESEKVIVGLYDEDGTLIEKFTLYLDDVNFHRLDTHENKYGYFKEESMQTKKILNHITTTNGYIRIVVRKYLEPDFDLKVPSLLPLLHPSDSEATVTKG